MKEITSKDIRMWSRLGQRGAFFGVAMPDIAERKENVKLLTADLAILSGMDRYIKSFPDKFLNVGIAEQNMIGIAAGLARNQTGKRYSNAIAENNNSHIQRVINIAYGYRNFKRFRARVMLILTYKNQR